MNDRPVDKTTIGIRRDRFIAGLVSEVVSVENFNNFPVAVEISLQFDSDFDDIFTIRGITGGTDGKVEAPTYKDMTLMLSYQGKDGHQRNTVITFDTAPSDVSRRHLLLLLSVEPHEDVTDRARDPGRGHPARREIPAGADTAGAAAEDGQSVLRGDDGMLQQRVDQQPDLQQGVPAEPVRPADAVHARPGDVFYSAGVPWYDALFGRDSIIASMQVIPYNPAISKSTLRLLARYQGKKSDPWRDEEPGKILHELRVGEKANLNEIPQTRTTAASTRRRCS